MMMHSVTNERSVGMIGIGGAGMRGLAYLLSEVGVEVEGTDILYEKLQSDFQNKKYRLITEDQMIKKVADCGSIIYSDAVPSDHQIRRLAKIKSVRLLGYHEAVGELAQNYKVLAVTGTHGKSSTTGMLAKILVEAGLDPTVLVGAGMPEWGGMHARYGEGEYLVIEADEYREHFLSLNPERIIITSIDYDHPDYYSSLDEVKKAYEKFMGQLKQGGQIITLKSIKAKNEKMKWPATTIGTDMIDEEIELPVVGEHMRANASLAIGLAESIGVDREMAVKALKSFKGLARRMEKLGQWQGIELFSDYGHHPTEIAATISGIKAEEKDKKILVLFEAHMEERLIQYNQQFIAALSEADGVIMLPTFRPKGREGNNSVIEKAEKQLDAGVSDTGTTVKRVDDYDKLVGAMEALRGNYEMIVGFTAGILDEKLRKMTE